MEVTITVTLLSSPATSLFPFKTSKYRANRIYYYSTVRHFVCPSGPVLSFECTSCDALSTRRQRKNVFTWITSSTRSSARHSDECPKSRKSFGEEKRNAFFFTKIFTLSTGITLSRHIHNSCISKSSHSDDIPLKKKKNVETYCRLRVISRALAYEMNALNWDAI